MLPNKLDEKCSDSKVNHIQTQLRQKDNMVKGKKTGKKKSGKSTSNVFSMFEQQQIQEFKEAFGMIDANRDGFIDKDDLRFLCS